MASSPAAASSCSSTPRPRMSFCRPGPPAAAAAAASLRHQAAEPEKKKRRRPPSALPEPQAAVALLAAAGTVGALLLRRSPQQKQQQPQQQDDEKKEDREESCPDCGGTGLCGVCKGEGFVFKQLSEETASKARKAAKNMATRYTAGLPSKWTYCNKCSSTRSCATCRGSGTTIITK